MAIKTFTAGEILTAADTNTYLANSGLTYITSGALSSTATNFAGCFTSTYDNYRIVLSSISLSADADIYWRGLVGTTPSTSADYSFAFLGIRADNTQQNATNPAVSIAYTGITAVGGVGGVIVGSASIDMYGPKLAQRTFSTSNATGYNSGFYCRQGQSHFNLTTSFDGIQFLTTAAPTMTGTVTIFGYRKP
jgi:hypothetical protein